MSKKHEYALPSFETDASSANFQVIFSSQSAPDGSGLQTRSHQI